ncbi:MAG: hypothetical protein ABIO57_00945 [Candidatus Paceibacterota bacterium]
MRTKKGAQRLNRNASDASASNLPVGDRRDKQLGPRKTPQGNKGAVRRQY